MTEKHYGPPPPKHVFYAHLTRNAAAGAAMVAGSLALGMFGYHFFEHMDWTDAFANAAMILSGMGPLVPLATEGGKLFAGFYALFSGLMFIFIVGLVFGPVAHRYLHRFHFEAEQRARAKKD